MQAAVLRSLEFDRIREVLARDASTPLGRARARALEPAVEREEVQRRLDLTREAVAMQKSGARPALDRLDAVGNPQYTLDFRAVYAAIISQWWKLDPQRALRGRFDAVPFLEA